jgi:hypothetical protein
MKLTQAESRVLHALHVRAWSEQTSRNVLCVRRDLERRMLSKGLISKRAFAKGYIAATHAGRSAFSNGDGQ